MKALIEEETEKIPIEEEIESQRAKLTTSTPMTLELFMQWKKKKMEERDAGLAAQQAERAKNDRMSGRELFLLDSSLFVDDVEAYEKYQREEESDVTEQKLQVDKNSATDGPSISISAAGEAEVLLDDDNDDDELDMDELNELEASLSRTSIQISEPESKK
uniref:ZC3H15/TMA46 family C-terminal domain-containing protein n=1 Tax=Davidia involucrata TaxID=16924 RepID=A0A5B7AL07_DAVIN